MDNNNDISVDIALCLYCGACVAVCPKDAIFLDDVAVKIHKDSCIKCGLCIKECPMAAISAGWFK